AYAVAGFRADGGSLDLEWSRSLSSATFLVDNNGRPTVGGGLALTVRLGDTNDVTLGASGMHGTFDPMNSLSYTIAGADLSGRFGRTQVRAGYLGRGPGLGATP